MRGGSLPALVGAPWSSSDLSTWGSSNHYSLNTDPIIFTENSFEANQSGGKRRSRRGGRRIRKKRTRKSRRHLKRPRRSKRKNVRDIHPYFLRHGGKRNKSRRLRRSRRRRKRRTYQRGGGLFDTRFTTPFPQTVSNTYQTATHGLGNVFNGLKGNELGVNPDPTIQPIDQPLGPGAYNLAPPNVQSALQSSNNSVANL
jgi:hypothetical protein